MKNNTCRLDAGTGELYAEEKYKFDHIELNLLISIMPAVKYVGMYGIFDHFIKIQSFVEWKKYFL